MDVQRVEEGRGGKEGRRRDGQEGKGGKTGGFHGRRRASECVPGRPVGGCPRRGLSETYSEERVHETRALEAVN